MPAKGWVGGEAVGSRGGRRREGGGCWGGGGVFWAKLGAKGIVTVGVVGIFKDGFHWVKQTTDTVSFSPEAWSVASGESGGEVSHR